jgi:hypothetical protein
MNQRAWIFFRWASALLGALALAGAGQALLHSQPPAVVEAPTWLFAALGVGFLGLWLLLWCGLSLGFGLGLDLGRRTALQGSLAWCLALAWPAARRIHLPYPHDLPERALQILLAAALLSGLALSLWRFLGAVQRSSALAARSPRWMALRLGGLIWIVYLASSLWTWRWLMTGDAPTYVLISATLSKEGSVDLRRDYLGGEWRRYYPLERDLETPAYIVNNKMVSEHRPLLPLLLAPGYKVGGFAGAFWIHCFLGALATALFYLLLRHRGMEPGPALWGWAVFALGAPWLIFTQSILVEVLAGLCGLAWLCAWEGVLPRALAWLLPALMPWIGTRLTVCSAGACLAWAWAWRKQPFKALGPGLLLALSLALNSLSNRWILGDASLQAYYNTNGLPVHAMFSLTQSPRYLFGLLIDQEYGLLPWAPVLLLAALGFSLWVRRRDRLLLPLLGWGLPYFALMSCFSYWTGPMAPARYLIPLVPFAALAVAEGAPALAPRRWPLWLAGLSWVLALVMEALPWFCFSKGQGECWPLRFLQRPLGLRLTPAFPSFIINTPQSYLWALALVLVAIRLAWHPALARRHPH